MPAGDVALDSIVLVVGLSKTPQYNFCAARLIDAEADGRLGVQLLHGTHKRLAVRRRNLLRASHPDDRQAFMTRIVWERQQELRVVRRFLLQRLGAQEGLCLHIASFFPPRQTMGLTTGFAMGRIIKIWSAATLDRGRLSWRPIHNDEGATVYRAERVTDGIVRIDCAVVDCGAGNFLVAGGCDDHPARARAFFRSAFVYDALAHAVCPLPDMPCARHGCGGAFLGGKAYIVGGEYADEGGPGATLVSVFDFATGSWAALEATMDQAVLPLSSPIAFTPVGAVAGRLVMLVEGVPLAYNPLHPEAGWCLCKPDMQTACAGKPPTATRDLLGLGTNAQACAEWGEHLVVASGRGGSPACRVVAFSFVHPPTADRPDAEAAGGDGQPSTGTPRWACGQWTELGPTGSTGRVGCGLTVVHDRLYVSGGVDEAQLRGRFNGTVARWAGTRADLAAVGPGHIRSCERLWHVVEELELPTAMHAHSAITIPWVPCKAHV